MKNRYRKKTYSNEEKILLSLPKEYFNESWKYNKKKVLQNVNWRALFIFAKRNSLINFTYLILREYMPEKYKDSFQKEYIQNQTVYDTFLLALQEIYEENIAYDIIVNKGFALSQTIYGDIYLRNVSDIDLISDEKNHEKADKLLRAKNYEVYESENGVKQSSIGLQYKEKTIVPKGENVKYKRVKGHELEPYRKELNGIWVEVELARHLHMIQEEMPYFFKHVTQMSIGSIDVKCFDKVHLFLALVDNTFQDSETYNGFGNLTSNVRNYIDLYIFLKKAFDEKQFFQIIEKSVEYHFILELQRVIENLEAIFKEQFIKKYLKMIRKVIKQEKPRIESHNYFVPWLISFRERVFDPYRALKQFYFILDRDRAEDKTDYSSFSKFSNK